LITPVEAAVRVIGYLNVLYNQAALPHIWFRCESKHHKDPFDTNLGSIIKQHFQTGCAKSPFADPIGFFNRYPWENQAFAGLFQPCSI
jgi:hypothetical protein